MNSGTISCHTTQVWPNGDVTTNGGTTLFNVSSYSGAGLPSPTPTPSPTATPATVVGDLNGDHLVNILDLSSLLSSWGKSSTTADLNRDGTVSILDLSLLLSHWGT
jgi:hypothetical protein